MKKTTVYALALAAITFSACSDNSSGTTDTHQQEATSETESAAGKVVVETPTFNSVPDPFRTQVEGLLDEYLKLKEALVEGNAETAQSSAESIVRLSNSMPVATLVGDMKDFAEEKTATIKESASQMAEAADLAKQRQQLEQLSEATFAMTKAFGAADQALYYQHCPMAFNDKGAYWLSSEEEIRNPYFGESMLHCGSNEEVYRD